MNELLNTETIIWALGICTGIYVLRFILLKSYKLNLKTLFYIAPRGLITILLFLSIPKNQLTDLSNKSLVIQVIILTTIIMMVGLMTNKEDDDKNIEIIDGPNNNKKLSG